MKKGILIALSLIGFLCGCSAVGTSTGNPSTPKAEAFPAGLAVASPFETVSADGVALLLSQTTPFVKGYADAAARIEAILNGTTSADCRFDPALLSRIEDDAGCYGPEVVYENHPDYAALAGAVAEVAVWLAQAIIRDGEGATKFITVKVAGGKTEDECSRVAFRIAHSPLVKTAFFASDPNLGRLLCAIGNAAIPDLDVGRVELHLGDVLVARDGGRNPAYREEDGQRVMQQSEITVRVDLARGAAQTTVWTCDLSHDYVSINADYRS